MKKKIFDEFSLGFSLRKEIRDIRRQIKHNTNTNNTTTTATNNNHHRRYKDRPHQKKVKLNEILFIIKFNLNFL